MIIKPEIVVAVDRTGGFGKDGKIPWSLPEDLQKFKELTTGHICVMGRVTYQEILEARKARDAQRGVDDPIVEILRNRESYVVSSDPNLDCPGATRVEDLTALLYKFHFADEKRKVFIIGGRRMFIEGFTWTDTVHLTLVKGGPYDCDVFFPIDVLNRKFRIVSGTETDSAYFVTYQRIKR